MKIPKKSLRVRIIEALSTFPEGKAMYTHLMYKVWPRDQYPRAYRGGCNGGPPGVAWVFGAALNRMHEESLIMRPATIVAGEEERYGQRDIWITSAGRALVEKA